MEYTEEQELSWQKELVRRKVQEDDQGPGNDTQGVPGDRERTGALKAKSKFRREQRNEVLSTYDDLIQVKDLEGAKKLKEEYGLSNEEIETWRLMQGCRSQLRSARILEDAGNSEGARRLRERRY